jgi:RNA-splicing ligase RtcB
MDMPQQLAEKLISWATVIEDSTRKQAITTSSLPFIFPHLALMPDAHLGKGVQPRRPAPRMGDIEYRDTDAFIDEIPAAYKDVEQVTADAADLVEVKFRPRQIVNVKGD